MDGALDKCKSHLMCLFYGVGRGMERCEILIGQGQQYGLGMSVVYLMWTLNERKDRYRTFASFVEYKMF